MGDVLYCGLEDSKRRMQSRVEKILGPANKGWPENFTFRSRLNALDAGGLDTIENWLVTHPNRRLVVIDTLGKVRGMKNPREEQYQYDYRLVGALQELATRYAVAIVIVHHVRKSDAEDVLDTVSGTTGIAGAADAVKVLGKTNQGAVRLYLRGRDVIEQDKVVEFDPETALWNVIGDYEPESSVGAQGQRRQVLELLGGSPIALTPIQIARRLNIKGQQARMALFALKEADPPLVVRDAAGGYSLARAQA